MMKWGFVSAVILFSVQRAMSVVLVFGEQSFFSSAWNFSFNNTFCFFFIVIIFITILLFTEFYGLIFFF